jgi:acetolactate synthase-1/2/3 large subunit
MQNISDQAGIVRGYTKHIAELRSGKNTQQMVYRALQIANSDPQGPVYMMATREALEEEGWDLDIDLGTWTPVAPMGLDGDSLAALAGELAKAENPMIITSYLGRNTDSVGELAKLSEKLAIPVYENAPRYMNFPADHPMYLGSMAQPALKTASHIFVIDCDVPWITTDTTLRDDCKVYYLDIDPIKETIPLWHIPAQRYMKADSYTALKQLNERLDREPGLLDSAAISQRFDKVRQQHADMREKWKREAEMKPGLTADYVSACVAEVVNEDTILINETISAGGSVERQIPRTKPGTRFGCGGSSLGWFGGAALGAKLAHPDRDVVALASDGVYIFSAPTAVYWMARRYNAPFLTVVYNNQGWNAPKMATVGQHPDGYAKRNNTFWTSFDPPARLDAVAEAAGGAFARTVTKPEEMRPAVLEAWEAVKSGRPAVINAILPPV